MIAADDLDALHDPDEFGVEVLIEEAGTARPVRGLQGSPVEFDKLRRSKTNGNDAGIRARAELEHLRVANRDVPAAWRTARVTLAGALYSIADVEPLGRLRSLLTLVPYGDRVARQEENAGGWLPPRPGR